MSRPARCCTTFPTKTDLFCAALGHLFEQRNDEFRKAMADLEPGADRTGAGIDLLWSIFQGSTFVAWLELWVAARTDAELAGPLGRLDAEFMTSSEAIFREFFAAEVATDPDLPRIALGLVFNLMNGLALCRLVPGYQPTDPAEILDAFKALIQLVPTGEEAS